MKIVRVSGGLGNQMFQFAFYKALQHAGYKDVRLDLSAYTQAKTHGGIDFVHNGFELERLFGVEYEAADEADVKRLSTQPTSLANRFRRKYLTKKSHFIDTKFYFQPELLQPDSLALPQDCYLDGNWQSERYFSQIAAEIRGLFSFALPFSARTQELLSKISGNTASIHVRRGDYLNTKTMNVCSKSYYQNAVTLLREHSGPESLLVFSDDIGFCKEELNLEREFPDITYVDWNTGADSWQDMALMAQCRLHVIPNSSFSWWGAWLDPHPNKLVIAPEHWNLTELDATLDARNTYKDVLPQGWLRARL